MISPLRIDPSRLGGIRRQVQAKLNGMYRALVDAIRVLLVERDVMGLQPSPTTFPRKVLVADPLTPLSTNKDWAYATSDQKLGRFRAWLRKKLDVTTPGNKLVEDWINAAHGKGAGRAYTELRRVMPEDDVARLKELQSREAFIKRMKVHKPTVEKVNLLASRTFNELEGVNNIMASRMSRMLAEGLATGQSPNTIAARMVAETKLGAARALAIVRTELVRAHAEGQLDAMSGLGQSSVTAQIEFVSADDSRVCPRCSGLAGRVFGVEEARGIIPVHPNCRCAWVPVTKRRAR